MDKLCGYNDMLSLRVGVTGILCLVDFGFVHSPAKRCYREGAVNPNVSVSVSD